jgi:hypothetical protein
MNLSILIAVVVVVAALTLAWLVLRDRDALLRRLLALFRRPQKPGQTPGSRHYYKPYWS